MNVTSVKGLALKKYSERVQEATAVKLTSDTNAKAKRTLDKDAAFENQIKAIQELKTLLAYEISNINFSVDKSDRDAAITTAKEQYNVEANAISEAFRAEIAAIWDTCLATLEQNLRDYTQVVAAPYQEYLDEFMSSVGSSSK